MAQQTITALYDDYDAASTAVTQLEAAGIPHANISIVSSNEGDRHAGRLQTTNEVGGTDHGETAEKASGGAGTGATLGTVLGGAAGLLTGLGLLAIPGVGPVVAAGWLVTTPDGGRDRRRRRRARRWPDRCGPERGRRPHLQRGRAARWYLGDGAGRAGSGAPRHGYPRGARLDRRRRAGAELACRGLDGSAGRRRHLAGRDPGQRSRRRRRGSQPRARLPEHPRLIRTTPDRRG